VPAISQRFASTEGGAKEGKIHQVIGAVVDGAAPASTEARERHAELTAPYSQVRH